MLSLLGQILDQLWCRVAAQSGHVDGAQQKQFQDLLHQRPIVCVDGVLQPTVGHRPPALFHELAEQLRLRALEDLNVDALGHQLLAEFLH